MIKLGFTRQRPNRILCLGAHSDDIEIGCGGTILKIVETCKDAIFHWVVLSSGQERDEEARKSASLFLGEAGWKSVVVVKNFRDSYFPYIGLEIKDYFGQIKKDFTPDLILTHYRNDLHQDHRTVSELTWNIFRDHLILEYEIPKYDGDFGTPNFFVHLNESMARRKVAHILDTFRTQQGQDWFDEETFLAVLKLRGIESHSPTKYAEAFFCRKIILDS